MIWRVGQFVTYKHQICSRIEDIWKFQKVGMQKELKTRRVVASPYVFWGFPSGSAVKNPAMQETQVWSLGWKDLLEEEMATHSSIFAWRIPWTEEPGRLQCMGSQRVGHDCSDWARTHTHTYIHVRTCLEQLHRHIPSFPGLTWQLLFSTFTGVRKVTLWKVNNCENWTAQLNTGKMRKRFLTDWWGLLDCGISRSISSCLFFFFLRKLHDFYNIASLFKYLKKKKKIFPKSSKKMRI